MVDLPVEELAELEEPRLTSAYVSPGVPSAPTAMVRVAQPIQDLDDRSTPSQRLLIEAPLLIHIRNADRITPARQLSVMTEPGSPMAEQFRVLSLRVKEDRGLRVVAVVGPTAQAQAARAAANLALALGEGTRSRVLLIDADLRQPELGGLFGIPEAPGLSDQVRRHRRQPTETWEVLGISATVSLLTAGTVEKNPAAVLSAEAVGDLIGEARRAFDYIVVSPPPVLESADAVILQDHLDGAILAVRVGLTRRHSVQASIDRLGARRFRGTVMLDA